MQSSEPEDQRDRVHLRSRICERHRASLELIFWFAIAKNPTPNLRYSGREISAWFMYVKSTHIIDLRLDFGQPIVRSSGHASVRRRRPERNAGWPICAVVRLAHCAKAKPIIPAAQMP